MTDQPAPAYLDPLHDELDRLRTENRRLSDHLGNATVAARAGAVAEIMLEQAEARVDQLTDQLNLANDTLRRRTDSHRALVTTRLACPHCSTLPIEETPV